MSNVQLLHTSQHANNHDKLTQFGQQLQQLADRNLDYITDTRNMKMGVASNALKLRGIDDTLPITDYAHSQIAQRLGIPKKYYDTISPELRALNVNAHWQHTHGMDNKTSKLLVRTQDNNVRAVMSDRYRIIDHIDVANTVLPVLTSRKDLKVISANITERKLYLKVAFTDITHEMQPGDVVQSGLIIMNSEVGAGAFEIAPYMHRLWCSNGCYNTEFGQRKNHVGRAFAADNDKAYAFYRDETLALEDAALLAKVKDTVVACIDEVLFAQLAGKFAETLDIKLAADPVTVVERVAKQFAFTETEQQSVVRHLVSDDDLEGARDSAYGVINAITRTAQDIDNVDRANELERIGGNSIDLPRSQWQRLGAVA